MNRTHPIPLTHERHAEALAAVGWAVGTGGYMLTISELEQDRSDAQRALNWAWNREISQQGNHSPEYIHGHSKLTYLLPMYKSWSDGLRKRAEFIESVLDHVPEYSKKVAIAYDMVRTRNLSVKRMAEYLTKMQQEYAQQGIILESNDDLEFKNLMQYAENK